MEILFAFIVANVFIVLFNVVGMGIMTYQIDDYLSDKRKDLFRPPPLKVYVLMWATVFLIALVVLSF